MSEKALQTLISSDAQRWHLLDIVRSLALPDCWIGAGFVRNAVWDHLHGRALSPLTGDVDVLWFDATCTKPQRRPPPRSPVTCSRTFHRLVR